MIGRVVVVLLISVLFGTGLIAQELEGKSYSEIDDIIVEHYQNSAYEQAIACTQFVKEKAKNEFGIGDSVHIEYTANLAFFFQKIGDYAQAEDIYLEAQIYILKDNGKESEEYSTVLNNLANVYSNMGQYEMAEPLLGEAMSIDRRLFGSKSQAYGTTSNNLALLYIKQERYTMAEPLLFRSMEIRKKNYGENHPAYAKALNNIGGLYMMMERYKEAVPYYLDAKEIREKTIGKAHPSYANFINNLATLYKLQKKYTKAEPLHLEALKIEEKLLGVHHPQYINTLTKVADLYYSMGEYNLAWSFLQQSMRATIQVDLSMNITEAWKDSLLQLDVDFYTKLKYTFKNLDITYKLLSKESKETSRQKQIIVVDLALALLERGRNSFLNYKDKLRLLSESNNWILRSLSLLDASKDAAKAFNIAEQNKSVLLMEASQAQAAYQMGDLPDSLIQLEQEMIKEQEITYSKLQDKRAPKERDSLRILLNELNKEIKAFKSQIKRNYPKYVKLKYQQNHAEASEIQKLLKKEEALLEYVIADSVVYIIYIDQHNLRVIEQPLIKKELRRKIEKMHRTLSNYSLLSKEGEKSYRAYRGSAHWFYQNLVAPALDSSSNIKELIVITDGELGHLPFEVFLVEAAPQKITDYANLHYLINDYVLSYHYSASLWKESKEAATPANNHQVLGMTAKYQAATDSINSLSRLLAYQRIRKNLDTLPNAKAEVKMLSKQFEGWFAFDEMSSEKLFKEKASQFAVIHLAMHGLLNSRAQMLSSLVFTEDGDSIENNFLQAYEISKLNLNANLVVLSACETGYGKFEKGNGIASLARSFMYAGASSLIVSLWQVNDFSTSKIMKFFYQNLAKGMDKGEALRSAKLEYMETAEGIFKHPAFWSPFIQIGTKDAIQLAVKSKPSFLWWGLGILGIAVLLGFFMRKK